mmetsp:Transcript_67050/g.157312  ORF Transcript_67050/g.157312 Transcript_67050/m.157312 type:complete len:269 (+) Transcript_67050:2524-3330(+)
MTIDPIEGPVQPAGTVADALCRAHLVQEVRQVGLIFVADAEATLSDYPAHGWLHFDATFATPHVAHHPVPILTAKLWMRFVRAGAGHHRRRELVFHVGDGILANLPLVLMLPGHERLCVVLRRNFDPALGSDLHNDAHGSHRFLPHVPKVVRIADHSTSLLHALDSAQKLPHAEAQITLDLLESLLPLGTPLAVLQAGKAEFLEVFILGFQQLRRRKAHLLRDVLKVQADCRDEGLVAVQVGQRRELLGDVLPKLRQNRGEVLPEKAS